MLNMSIQKKERGAALLTALAFLIIITLLSINAIRTSTLELTMASNEQAGTEALQSAQSAIDALIQTASFQVQPGYVGCYNIPTGTTAAAECTANTTLSGNGTEYSATTNQVKIRLVSSGSFACRACASSAKMFNGAVFNIQSNYDNTANRGGRVGISEGFLMLIPKN